MSQDYENHEPLRGMAVRVKNNDVNRALRKLKRLLQTDGIFQEMRAREYYEKPSMKRKREKAQAKKRWQKKLSEMNQDPRF